LIIVPRKFHVEAKKTWF